MHKFLHSLQPVSLSHKATMKIMSFVLEYIHKLLYCSKWQGWKCKDRSNSFNNFYSSTVTTTPHDIFILCFEKEKYHAKKNRGTNEVTL